jgi:hypothetical protein
MARTNRLGIPLTDAEQRLLVSTQRHGAGLATWARGVLVQAARAQGLEFEVIDVKCPDCGHTTRVADNGWHAIICQGNAEAGNGCRREIKRTEVA